ncbi:hypothetical protein ECG_01762 [Echinococcus granulosus]|nr:hypothetical protein ECG_01760 [Echinococcus granulosus]KAH9286299.1 hypothetical protein ECG_01762 [Echinococcus granulosus]
MCLRCLRENGRETELKVRCDWMKSGQSLIGFTQADCLLISYRTSDALISVTRVRASEWPLICQPASQQEILRLFRQHGSVSLVLCLEECTLDEDWQIKRIRDVLQHLRHVFVE